MQHNNSKPVRRTTPYKPLVQKAVKYIPPTMSFLIRDEVLISKNASVTLFTGQHIFTQSITDGVIIGDSLTKTLEFVPTYLQVIYDGVKISDTVSIAKKHWLSGIIPDLLCYVWNPWDVSPSGHRHIPNSQGFLHDASSDNIIDFGTTDATPTTSDNRAITFAVAPQPGVFSVTNLRLWQSQTGPYTPADTTINFEALAGSGWSQLYDNSNSTLLPTTLPASQNVFREDGSPFIDGSNLDVSFPPSDHNTSQFCYLSVNLSAAWPIQQYDSSTTFAAVKCTYDYMIGGYHADASGVV